MQSRLLFCPVTALAGSLFLNRPWTTPLWFFSKSSSLSHRATLAGLWVASHQLCHERSGLPPPSLEPPPAYASSPFYLARLLVDRAIALIPAPFRPSHVQQSVPIDIKPGCFRDGICFRALTIELEGHPQYYGLVPTTAASIPAEYVISILPLRSNIPKRLFMFQSAVPSPPNCTLQFRLCSCGTIHGYLVSLTPLPPHSRYMSVTPLPRNLILCSILMAVLFVILGLVELAQSSGFTPTADSSSSLLTAYPSFLVPTPPKLRRQEQHTQFS